MKKLPYIPDRDLYAAVMFACKIVRNEGHFNKGCKIAASYYDVDEDEVKRYVRIAQGNGQRQANKKNPRKYYWFLVEYVPDHVACDDCGTRWTWDYTEQDYKDNTRATIVKATSEENAQKRVSHIPDDKICGFYFNEIMSIKKFNTQKEAKDYARNYRFDHKK